MTCTEREKKGGGRKPRLTKLPMPQKSHKKEKETDRHGRGKPCKKKKKRKEEPGLDSFGRMVRGDAGWKKEGEEIEGVPSRHHWSQIPPEEGKKKKKEEGTTRLLPNILPDRPPRQGSEKREVMGRLFALTERAEKGKMTEGRLRGPQSSSFIGKKKRKSGGT